MRRRRPEDALQIACADYCHLALHPSVLWHHSVNEGKRGRAAAGLAKAMGQRAGWPDFVFVWSNGAPIPLIGFIELKCGRNSLSDAQETFRDQAMALGAEWALCRSLDEFIAAVKIFGIPTRGAGRAAA